MQLLLRPAPRHDDFAHRAFNSSLEDQWRIDNNHAGGIPSPLRVGEFLRAGNDMRVDDGVEGLEELRVGEYQWAQLPAVNAATGIENPFSKSLDDFLIGGLARFNDLVPQAVGVDDVRAQFLEMPRCGAFSGRDATGQAESRSRVGDRQIAPPWCCGLIQTTGS